MADPKKTEEVKKPMTEAELYAAAEAALDAAGEGFLSEQTGFPPYWNPAVFCTQCKKKLGEKEFKCEQHKDAPLRGSRFLARLLDVDDMNPKFKRFILQATSLAIPCQNGPAIDAEKVLVKPGEYFTCSEYSGVDLENYFGHEILLETTRKRYLAPSFDEVTKEKKEARTLWNFKLSVPDSVKKILDANRSELVKLAQQQFKERAAKELEERLARKAAATPDVKEGEFVEQSATA